MKRWGWIVLGVIGAAQLVQPHRSTPAADPDNDLIARTTPTADVERLLRVACYDCHSSKATYPWYSYVTPVNFWLQHHVDEGREEFNMSEWGGRKAKWQRHKAEEASEMLRNGEMPLSSYTWIHTEAQLTKAQRDLLAAYFNGLKNAIPDQASTD